MGKNWPSIGRGAAKGVGAKVYLDIEGIRAIRKKAPFALAGYIADAAQRVERGAKRRCPVDTGKLKASIGQIKEDRFAVTVTYAVSDPDAYYGLFIELGTRHSAAQPFLGPAMEEERPIFQHNLAKLAKHLEEEARKAHRWTVY